MADPAATKCPADYDHDCPDLCSCCPTDKDNKDTEAKDCPPGGMREVQHNKTGYVPTKDNPSSWTTLEPCDNDPCASKYPVVYGSGAVSIQQSSYGVQAYGGQLRDTHVYNNLYAGSSGGSYTGVAGYGWNLRNRPRLISQSSGDTILVYLGTEVIKFVSVSGVYQPQPFRRMELRHDTTAKTFTLVDTSKGSAQLFNDFDASHAAALRGQPIGWTGASGSQWNYVLNSGGNATSISMCPSAVSAGNGAGTTSGGCQAGSNTPGTKYVYTTIGGNSVVSGSQTGVTDPDTGDTSVRNTAYDYYTSDVSGKGSTGDLQFASTQVCTGNCTTTNPTWTTIKKSYYRYYTSSSSIGFQHGLKFLLGPEAYQRAVDGLSPTLPENATDTQLQDYADHYFEYDSSQRVTKERRFGYGTGSVTSTYAYTVRGGSPQTDYNQWQRKTVETQSESGKVITVYTNFMAQVLLRDVQSGSSHWYDYYEYDSEGRVTLTANPSGITGYSQTGDGALSVTKNTSTGLFLVRAYYGTSDTAPGHLKYAGVKKGYSGTLVKQQELEWIKQTDGYGTVYVISKQTDFLTETDQTNSANQSITTFAYEFQNNQVTKKTTTLPAVPTSQNGENVTNTIVEEFDPYGYMTKKTDPRGVITVYEWNPAQGMLMKVLKNWINASTYIPVDYEYDHLGRTTKITQTVGSDLRIKWIVYDDLNFERREASGYYSGGSTWRYNPATIYKYDRANRVIEIREAADSTSVKVSGALTSSTSFPQSGWSRWQVFGYDNHSLLTYRREYFDIPSSGSGSSGTNYNQTDFGYSATRYLNRIKSPGSTIRRMVYDARGKLTQTWLGTNDTGATDSNPGAGSSNLLKVQEQEWDGGSAGGDGNLTTQTDLVNATENRVTTFTYDWRDRRETTTFDMGSSTDIFVKVTYDNLSRAITRERRETNESGSLITKREFKFEKRGHLYQTIRYPASGSQTLIANYWYDEAGNRIKVALPSSASFTKTQYDNLGRVSKVFDAYGTDSTFAQIKSVSNNVVMRQTEYVYDDVDNQLQEMVRERYHDESTSDLGELQTPTSSTHKARVTCRALYYDEINRLTADVNYGTNGTPGTWSWTRPSTPAAYSADLLQTRNAYSERGELYQQEKVVGLASSTSYKRDSFYFDDAGRMTKQVENSAGTPTRTTEFEYTADGHLKKLIAWNATTGNQTTEWIYGVTTSNGSEFYSNQLVYQKKFPDSASSSDRVTYGYNRQNEVIDLIDQNGNEREIGYDPIGRFASDSVVTLGSGVDGSIRMISASYNDFGLNKITSYDSTTGTTVVNEVERTYNEWGQLLYDYQEHSGATNGSTPKVYYWYENGSGNNVRPTRIFYPTSSNTLDFLYGTPGGQDDVLSRVKQLKWNNTVVAEYSHLGLDRTVVVDYQEPDVKWNLVPGSGNYPYTGLDQFDRVVDALWQYYGGTPANREEVLYGFDRANNRLWRQNTVAGTGQDEYYTYDQLFRITNLDRGTLNGTKTGISGTPSWEEDWNFDETGNWHGSSTGYQTKVSGSTTLNQNRTHNVANEITDITESTGTAWPTPSHDGNGNLTVVPRPLSLGNSYDLKYDAWNRLVEVKNTGGATVATYRYDGFFRRVSAYDGANTRHYYYSDQWQILEERLNSGSSAERSFVWGLRYLDDLVLRQKSSERLYALHDYYSVTAIVNTSGTVLERYGYDAFGGVRYMDASFGSRSSSSYGWETLYGAYRYDSDTGLYQARFRYLHSKLGRWISRDPIEEVGGVNLYAYLGNNSINFVDFLGLCDAEITGFAQGGGWELKNVQYIHGNFGGEADGDSVGDELGGIWEATVNYKCPDGTTGTAKRTFTNSRNWQKGWDKNDPGGLPLGPKPAPSGGWWKSLFRVIAELLRKKKNESDRMNMSPNKVPPEQRDAVNAIGPTAPTDGDWAGDCPCCK